jgi:HlyD family secretion protein
MDAGKQRIHRKERSMSITTTHQREEMARLLGGTKNKFAWRILKWPVMAILLVGLIAAGTLTMRTKTNANAPAYVTEPAKRGDLNVQVAATGKLQPTNTVQVGSELSGLVEAVYVDENDKVKKGQILAKLDTSKLQDQITKSEATLASAEAKLSQTDATLKEASTNLDRLREVFRLSSGKVPSQAEMATAEATFARAQADKTSAEAVVAEQRATLNSDRTNLAKASIRSPIEGIVLTRAVEPGQTVAASLQAPTLFTIAQDLREMELKVDVDEADVGSVQNGQKATFTVDAYPNRTYTADVIRVAYGSTTNADVVSYATVLKVRNNDLSLRPGMTASAEIAIASVKEALMVPNAALRFTPPATSQRPQSRGLVGSLIPGSSRSLTRQQPEQRTKGSEKRVWILRDGNPSPVTVTTGQTDGRYTEIVIGDIKEGTPVITDSSGATS